MQDDTLSEPLPLPRPRRRTLTTVLVALLAFAMGGTVVGWLVNNGKLPYALIGKGAKSAGLPSINTALPPSAPPTATASAPVADDLTALSGMETRLALLEDRLTRIDGEASAASGNAARAEALLIAYAARRRIAKGEPLDFVADQLKLRFGNAQPQAVQTIIAFAKDPITLDELNGELEAAAPVLTGMESEESTWTRVRHELASLFVVRRAPVSASTPETRVARAQLKLVRGQTDEAIAEVERLPGADGARAWIDAARRYEATQHALDVIETTAMLEPRGLRDSAGKAVDQPSPLAAAADTAPTAN